MPPYYIDLLDGRESNDGLSPEPAKNNYKDLVLLLERLYTLLFLQKHKLHSATTSTPQTIPCSSFSAIKITQSLLTFKQKQVKTLAVCIYIKPLHPHITSLTLR